MKICPICQFCYEDNFSLCPAEQGTLESAMPGSTILDNKFRLESRLGKGGMGLVYRAMHLGLKRYVAVKTLLPKNLSQKEFIERFRREAEVLGKLKHPNIVSVMDFGFTQVGKEDIGYLVMEFLSGISLGSLMKEKKTFSLAETVKIMSQVADAISVAHQLGVLHRDLKPDNIFIEDKTTFKLKVLDFGLAKVTDPIGYKELPESEETLPKYVESILKKLTRRVEPSSNKAIESAAESFELTQERKNLRTGEMFTNTNSLNLNTQDFADINTDIFNATVEYVTHTGAMVGTLPYMSPEQCCAKPATPASDVYSLGVISYELLTGRRPFLGKSFELALQHINDEPKAPSTFAPHLSNSVDQAILDALAKSSTERPSSAKGFVLALGRELAEKKRRNENLRRIAFWSMVAASLILVITTFANPTNRALISSYWYGSTSKVEKTTVNCLSTLKLVSLKGKEELLLTQSPKISLRPEDISEYQSETHFLSKFSPDGKLLAYFQPSRASFNVWDVNAGKLLYEVASEKLVSRITSLCFSTDNKSLIIAGVNRLLILNALDGSVIKLIDNFERNIFLQPFSKGFLVASIRRPILEEFIGETRYPLTDTNSLISVLSQENNFSKVIQQYGEIESVNVTDSKLGTFMLVQWHVSEKEPVRRIELWLLEQNSFKLSESWLVIGRGGGVISPTGEKVALHLSSGEITELDLVTKKELAKYKIDSSTLVALSYDLQQHLISTNSNDIKDLFSDTLIYTLPKNSRVLEINWKNNLVLLQRTIKENL